MGRRYTVIGASLATGRDVRITVEAASAPEAMEVARGMGVAVADVVPETAAVSGGAADGGEWGGTEPSPPRGAAPPGSSAPSPRSGRERVVRAPGPEPARVTGHVTVEQTGKQWKVGMLLGAGVILLGGFALCGGAGDAAVFLFLIGLVLLIGSRLGAWWHHG
jgi:hypothetical protein